MSEKTSDPRYPAEEPVQYTGDNDEQSYRVDYEQEQEKVHELARQLTQTSVTKGEMPTTELIRTMSAGSLNKPGISPFSPEANDSALDPNSDNFSALEWSKNMYRIYQSDPERYKPFEVGFAYRNLSAYGYGTDADFQDTVYNIGLKALQFVKRASTGFKSGTHVDILRPMDGVAKPGELTVVLGRPGAGCSTFLKTVAAQTYGFHVDEKADLNYSGLSVKDVETTFRGDVVYCAESETHFPHLTVGDTLLYAARLKTPSNRLPGVSRLDHATHMRDMVMAQFGLSHTINTKVGNDLVRGVSGGERKRVSIAEVVLAGGALQCWDNSTRGLDSASALEFCKSLKTGCKIFNNTSFVAVYQSSEEMYDLFDKVVLLYEGRQIYFGPANVARQFFYDMGFAPKPRQPTPDFLTSLTQPSERIVRPGFEQTAPRTPDEFEARYRASTIYQDVLKEIDQFNTEFPPSGPTVNALHDAHVARQSKRGLPHRQPYTVNFNEQVKILISRGFRRIQGDMTMPATSVFGNAIMGLILSSVFYNLPSTTSSFYSRGAILFFAILFNAFSSLLEIFSIYEARPVVAKHKQYALYDPIADAMASILTEFPIKVLIAIVFNLILYFMVNLRREPGAFFTYLLFAFMATLSMSHMFRTVGAVTKSLYEAMVPATVLLLSLVIYTGFAINVTNMHGWSRWINYINPIGYAFESLMANEFHNRRFNCSTTIPTGPGYENMPSDGWVCSGTGAKAGQDYIMGDDYIELSYEYYNSHKWRNLGIIIGFVVFFLGTYFAAVYFNPGIRSKGELLVFQRSKLKQIRKEQKAKRGGKTASQDIESGDTSVMSDVNGAVADLATELPGGLVETSNDLFFWRDVCYDIKIKGKDRRILDHVDGWVKPGTLTALMGASGAGKTTLLDTLANRVTMGVVTGDIFVSGARRDDSFQRSTGYAQQQDLHLQTTTVREALEFSALLRQPATTPRAEKLAYVDKVLKILEMEPYADAVVGVPGEGLNVEQRKRLTIGVELAAKPKLLLFLDEPTSGLDSQTAWSVCQLMKKLSNAGQAILCTIHQPSAMLFQEFDRLLFLKKGGQTVYFGDIGKDSRTLIDYFERNGADPCPPEANPAEWMLHVIGAAPGSHTTIDFAEVWNNSPERRAVRAEIDRLLDEFGALHRTQTRESIKEQQKQIREFAAPLWTQYVLVTRRTFEQYWRTPRYIWSKIILVVFSALFNGFTFFRAQNSLSGMQNLMFSIFIFTMVFNSLVQQLMPYWVIQRDLYEARERPSKIYSWKVFVASQITVEIPWQIGVSVIAFFCWYFPVGFYNNAGDQVTHREGLMFFYVLLFFLYIPSMAQMCIAGMELADTAANICSMLFTLTLLFCGVLATKEALPGFWIFMYRLSPFTYLIAGMLATGIANSDVVCSPQEFISVNPPSGMTCQEYLDPYFSMAQTGYVENGSATTNCQICTMSDTNTFLASIDSYYDERWKNLGIFIAFIAFNYAMTYFLYWLARVPKKKDRVKEEHGKKSQ